MPFLRLGDLIGLGVDPLDNTKDRNAFYVYKVCKTKVVAVYEISDSDDDEGVDVGNNSPITSDGPSTSSAAAAAHRDARRKSNEKFSTVDFDEAENEPKTANSSVVELDVDIDGINEAMKQINEAFNGTPPEAADNDATESLPSSSSATRQPKEVNEKQENLKKLAQEVKNKAAKLDKIAKLQKVPIIDAQRMRRKRGYREEPTSAAAPIASSSVASSSAKVFKKRGRKSKKEKELLKLKLSEIVTVNPPPEKKRREIDNPVRAKVTTMNRSDSLIADMINPTDIKGN